MTRYEARQKDDVLVVTVRDADEMIGGFPTREAFERAVDDVLMMWLFSAPLWPAADETAA